MWGVLGALAQDSKPVASVLPPVTFPTWHLYGGDIFMVFLQGLP